MGEQENENPLCIDGERRRTPPLTLRELEEHIDRRIKEHLAAHAEAEAKRMDQRFDELKELLQSAFPGGDPAEHKRYHEEAIEFMRERRELWKSIREKSITGLIWAALVGVGTAIWTAIRVKIGMP